VLGGQRFGLARALGAVVTYKDDLGPERHRSIELGPRGASRHDDNCPHAQRAGCVGYGLGVVAARVGDHTAAPLL
jgi:hypothetical protein